MRPVCLILGLFVAAACSLNNPGAAPPAGKIYFPTAVAVADGHLLVASSNFDVRYNSGSLQAYDLTVLNGEIDACLADPTRPGCDCSSSTPPDRPCVLANTADLLASEVLIDSFATGIAYSAASRRVYVPTRSNGGLTFVAFESGTLDCGQGETRCSSLNVAGTEPDAFGPAMPSHPTSVATGPASALGFALVDSAGLPLDPEFVLVGDEDGTLSLFIDDAASGDAPKLRYVRGGFAGSVTSIAVGDQAAYLSTAGGGDGKLISQVAFDQPIDLTDPLMPRPGDFLLTYLAANLRIASFGGGSTVRSLAFVPGSSSELLAVTLSPDALVRVDLQRPRWRSSDLLVESVVALGSGPSKVEVGVVGADGREFAFVSCFDSREIIVVDIELERVVSVIQGLTGPFSLALDTLRPRLYVGDFRSSTVRIVDLEPLVRVATPSDLAGREPASPSVIAILGQPSEVQALR